MDILLSKYGLIFTEFESIDLGSASSAPPRSILSNSVNIRPYLLSKKSIIVYYIKLLCMHDAMTCNIVAIL